MTGGSPTAADGTPLESLPDILGRTTLSTRTLGILLLAGIETMEHLADTHPLYLVGLPGVGKRTYREIALTRLVWRLREMETKEHPMIVQKEN